MQVTAGRVLIVGVGLGVLLNLLGWLGNVFWLGEEWRGAGELITSKVIRPYGGLTRELITFVSDFVYALTLTWLFSRSPSRTVGSALVLSVVLWVATVVMTYLALVNAAFIPAGLAVKTSLLALATFLMAAPLLPVLLKPRRAPGQT